MPTILYTVRVACPTIQIRGRFLSWLTPNHVQQVMAGGATSARVVLPDRENAQGAVSPELVERAAVETQYVFPSRKAFNDYIRDHAPALRADAMKHFPPESGVVFARQIAEIAVEFP
jgi:Domain of unknown function (DUF4286)